MRFQNYVYNSESVEESEDNKITNVVRIESSFGNRSLIFSSLRRFFRDLFSGSIKILNYSQDK